MGGGPLDPNSARSTRILGLGKSFPDMIPGHVIYFRPLAQEWRCLGLLERDVVWTAEWADAEDFEELVLTMRAFDLHVPWIYEHGVECAMQALLPPPPRGRQGREVWVSNRYGEM